MTGGQSLLLQRLQPHKLKKAGHNKWTFASPLREEKKASGTLTFDGDGVLIYDFGDETEGAADRILGAVGLTWPEVLSPRDGSISKPAHHDEKEARKRAEAAAKAGQLRTAGTRPGADQPYLQRKGLAPVETLREIDQPAAVSILGYPPKSNDEPLTGRLLIVPIKIGDALSTAELIDHAGRKHAIAGGRKTGGYWASGELPAGDGSGLTILVGEGVATCLSGSAATGYLAIAAFSCGNLLNVARFIRARYPKAKIVLLVDLGNGQSKAIEAARAVDGFVAVPDFGENSSEGAKDINDLHQARGLEAVRACIETAARPAPAEPVAADAVIPPDGQLHNTDVGHARRLAAHVRGWCHFVVEWNKYILFDGPCWKVDPAGVRILAETSAITKQLLADAAATDNKIERASLREESRGTESLRSKTNAIALLKAQPGIAIAAEAFDRHQFFLNFQNGTLDILSDQFRGHNPQDLLTCALPYNYDRAATCSLWRRVVSEIWPDADTAAFVQRFAGYCCTGSTKEQVLLFLWGHGANGKTLFAKVLQLLLGNYACQCTMSLLIETKQRDHTTEQADLRGRYLAVCAETPAGMYWNEVLLKNATGGDRMKARRLYEDNQEWDATHKFLILGNNKPRVRGQDYATWRRMILVHCDQTFPEGKRDPDLLEKLTQELPGIANWAIEGARMWLRDGLRPPARVKESTDDYRAENDVLGPFLLECCVENRDARCVRPAMYAAFATWTKAQGYDHVPSPQAFAELMRGRGFDDNGTMRVLGRSKPVWRGVGLLDRQTAMTAMTAEGTSGNFSATPPREGEFTENGHSTHSSNSGLPADPDDPGEGEVS